MSSGNDDHGELAMKLYSVQWSQVLVDQLQQVESEDSGLH